MSLSKEQELVAPPVRGGLSLGRFGAMREAGLIVIILALCVAMSFASPHFATWGNLRAMLMSFSIEGIVVVGMTVLLIVGGIDLAVGSVVCFAMVVGGSMFLMGLDPWTASLIAIAASALVGAGMGFFVTVVGLNHFITSLAAMVIVRGLCLVITKGTPLSLFTLPPEFKAIGQGEFQGVPYVIIIFVAIVVLFDFLLRRATAFRKVFYTGSNEKAAEYSGIRTRQVKFWVTVLCSTLADYAPNRNLVALTLEELAGIPHAIGVASGPNKAAPILAAMRGKHLDTLVTDEATARSVIALSEAHS